MKHTLAAFARNTVFANIVLVLIFVAGYLATTNMIRGDVSGVLTGYDYHLGALSRCGS